MITFQLDEDSDSKKFVVDCRQKGLSAVRRFPRSLKGKKDPQILPVLMNNPYPLITHDRMIAQDHSTYIPNKNPGIIIIKSTSPETMTLNKTEKIISNFKVKYPQWSAISWKNSLVEITEDNVSICHVEDGNLSREFYFRFDEDGWPEMFTEKLVKNSFLFPLPIFHHFVIPSPVASPVVDQPPRPPLPIAEFSSPIHHV